METPKIYTERSAFTRQCIAEALIRLMKTNPIEKISISDITKTAGVSRMTYYKYYQTKHDILSDYLHEIIKGYVIETGNHPEYGNFQEQDHIKHFFDYFSQYSDLVQTLIDAGQYSILIDALNSYMPNYVPAEYFRSPYELFYYSGALLNVFVQWVKNGQKESTEEVAQVVYIFLGRNTSEPE